MNAVRPTSTTPGAFLCPRCGNGLHEDQSWCLECGLAARTRVHPPPSWRFPLLETCVALVLLAAGIAFALVAVLDDPEPTPAATTVTVPAPAAAPPAATPTPATTAPPVTAPPTTSTPATTTPGAAPPTATTPTTPTTPATRARPRTFTVPGTGIELPATGN